MNILSLMALFAAPFAFADALIDQPAPTFIARTHDGKDFSLESRKGKWTVLFFYPKADTPGCTKQACTFRDSIKKVRDLGGDVIGISADSVEKQAKFHKKHRLNFMLLADADGKIIDLYGTKMPVVSYSKRWTFIVDPELKIRVIDKDVDPVLDAEKTAKKIAELQGVPAL
jgi:thioredoxin-dependent peroxiredoxin